MQGSSSKPNYIIGKAEGIKLKSCPITHDLICWLLIIWIPINKKKKKIISSLGKWDNQYKISLSLQLLFFCFSEILTLKWGSFELLVEWQMMMETRPWLPSIYIYVIKKLLKKKKDSLFLPLLSSLFSPSSNNIMNLKQNLFLLEIYNSSILLDGVSINSFIWITIL